MSTVSDKVDKEHTWLRLRVAYWRERVVAQGEDEDYVGLARALMQVHSQGTMDTLEETHELLREAAARHPRSLAVFEHSALVASLTGRSAELNDALATIERLDPMSEVLSIVDRITPESSREWADHVAATQAQLLEQAGSRDEHTADIAVRELARWARSFPADSTYAVNHALGLVARGRNAEAQQAALVAIRIEDGSFADACNIGQVLCHTGAREQGLAMLHSALERAVSDEERHLVADILAREEGR